MCVYVAEWCKGAFYYDVEFVYEFVT